MMSAADGIRECTQFGYKPFENCVSVWNRHVFAKINNCCDFLARVAIAIVMIIPTALAFVLAFITALATCCSSPSRSGPVVTTKEAVPTAETPREGGLELYGELPRPLLRDLYLMSFSSAEFTVYYDVNSRCFVFKNCQPTGKNYYVPRGEDAMKELPTDGIEVNNVWLTESGIITRRIDMQALERNYPRLNNFVVSTNVKSLQLQSHDTVFYAPCLRIIVVQYSTGLKKYLEPVGNQFNDLPLQGINLNNSGGSIDKDGVIVGENSDSYNPLTFDEHIN